jgi:hypothetical protein
VQSVQHRSDAVADLDDLAAGLAFQEVISEGHFQFGVEFAL